jgi:phospholipid/cholesterol/gamma-HCH transport system ATP-binding protein
VIALRGAVVEYFGRRALGPLSGTFGEKTLAVVGPAQSGKTTLLKALCGLLPLAAGEVLVDGAPLLAQGEGAPALRARFGMVFQSDALFDSMDALENAALPLVRRGLPLPEALARAGEALAQVGLSGHEHALPERLSGGMRKRLGIARAIVARPRYLLADDPLAGLDPGTAERVLALLLSLFGERGSLILAAAEPSLIWDRCDEVLLLREGEAVARGAPAALRVDPGVRALLGEEDERGCA